jgi:uncharacterized protein YceK
MLLFAMTLGLTFAGLGCATALNIQDATLCKPYGGVTMPITQFFGNNEASEAASVLFWPWWLFDKPLSLVGDTLTLPYILYVRRDTQPVEQKQGPQITQPTP